MKKNLLLCLSLIIILSGCFFGGKEPMDKPVEDGSYVYNNKGLGFSLTLPKEFIYFQTQSLEGQGYKDIEIFVPTSDKISAQEVEGYAKPIVVRVYKKDTWAEASKDENIKAMYQVVRENNNTVFTIKWWEKIPTDWQPRWTDEMKNQIVARFSEI